MGFGALATPIIQALQRKQQPYGGMYAPRAMSALRPQFDLAGGGNQANTRQLLSGFASLAPSDNAITEPPAQVAQMPAQGQSPLPTPLSSGFTGMNPDYQQFLQPTPEEENLRTLIAQGAPQARGWKGHLGGLWKGLLTGGLGGAVAGAIDPNLVNRAIYNQITLPQAQHLAQFSGQMNNQRLGRLTQIQQADEARRYHDAMIGNMRTNNDLAQRQFGFNQWKANQDLADKKADNERASATAFTNQQRDLTKEGGQYGTGMAELFTPRATNRGNLIQGLNGQGFFRMPSVAQEQQRKLEQERAKGEAELNLNLRGDAIKRGRDIADLPIKEEIKARYDTKETPEQRDERARVKEARNTHTKIQTLINRAAKQFEEAKSIVDPDKQAAKLASAQGDKDSADREIEIAKQLYPDLIEGGLGDGDFPYVKFKEPAASVRVTPLSRTQGGSSRGKTPKDMTQEEFEYNVRTRFNNDANAARAAAKKLGYSIGGQPIQ